LGSISSMFRKIIEDTLLFLNSDCIWI
jgi:hypothetical protein